MSRAISLYNIVDLSAIKNRCQHILPASCIRIYDTQKHAPYDTGKIQYRALFFYFRLILYYIIRVLEYILEEMQSFKSRNIGAH